MNEIIVNFVRFCEYNKVDAKLVLLGYKQIVINVPY